jgi:sterol desaturase/sphingolipid hydroxylase (fatty acid hydroxylase superfamily)
MALLDLHPDGLRAAEDALARAAEHAAGSARVPLFRRAWVDRALTRTWPPLPFVAYGGVIVALLGPPLLAVAGAARHGDVAALGRHVAAGLGLLAGGVLAWTLIEYALHRFGLHLPTRSPAWRVAYFLVHGHHHRAPRDAARTVATLWQSGALLGLLASMAWPALGALWGPEAPRVWLAGVVLGYLAYEAVHLAAHHTRPRTPLLRALVRHHLAHHAQPGARYGISSPLWDWVFGTTAPRRTGAHAGDIRARGRGRPGR